MELKGKTVAVLVEQQYQEMEVWYPYYRLKEAGASVMMVAPEANATYASKLGYPAKSDTAAKNVMAAMLDGEATVKVFRQRDGHTWLLPRNSAFEPILGDQAEVLGKVVAVLRTV